MSDLLTSLARVSVSPAMKYLTQLGKHFSHKVEVEMGDERATVRLSYGYFELRTEGTETLVMQTFADTDAHRRRLEHVAASHLERFAFRNPPTISWTDDV